MLKFPGSFIIQKKRTEYFENADLKKSEEICLEAVKFSVWLL